MEASIALKKVSKQLDNRYILSNLSFGIEKGSNFVVLGRNGEGKSTFLNLLAGIYTPTNGKIYIEGQEFNGGRELIKRIGFMGDIPLYEDQLTVFENLERRAQFLEMTLTQFKTNSKDLSKQFDLTPFFETKVSQCSMGIRKRLGIVLSLLHSPEIIIWDEPLAYLDFNTRRVLLEYLRMVKGEKTVVIATNEFTELHTVADRWIVLHNQGIRFDGDLEKMTTQVDLPFTGQVELKKEHPQIISQLNELRDIDQVYETGNSIEFQCKGLHEFYNILKTIDNDAILRVSCNSIDLEELLNQLLSDEGLV